MESAEKPAFGRFGPPPRLQTCRPARRAARFRHRHGRLPVRRNRALQIHRPTCSQVSHDEAILLSLCGLAQGDIDGPFRASLDCMMAPTASRVAAIRLKAFAVSLARAGLHLAPAAGESNGRLN